MHLRVRLGTAAAVLVTAALAVGCGGSSKHGASAPTTSVTTTATASTGASTTLSTTSTTSTTGAETASSTTPTTTTRSTRATTSVSSTTTTSTTSAKGPPPTKAHFLVQLTIGAGGALTPPSIAVAGGITIDLQLHNATAAAQTLTIKGGGGTFHLLAHGHVTETLPRLKNASYTLLLNGKPHGLLVVGANAGP